MEAGPFARDVGTVPRLAVVAAGLAASGLAAVAVRGVARAGGGDVAGAGRIALALGIAGVAAGLGAWFVTATRSVRGGGLAKVAAGGGAVVAIAAWFQTAIVEGTLQPGRFAEQYLDWEIIRTILPDLLRGLVNTLQLALVAEMLALVAGLVVATLVLSPRRWLHHPAVAYVDIVRGMPLVVLTFLINFGLPFVGITLGAFASPALILTINASGYVAEIFRAGIQSLPRGQTDAARSLGMPHGTAMLYVVIPQAVRTVIPPLVSEFIALIKDTAIVIVLVGFTVESRDLFGAASQAAASTFSPTPYFAAAVLYLAVTVTLARAIGRLERRLRARVA